jgi:hypothetical protein
MFRLLNRNGGICSETFENNCRKQLQDLRRVVALVSEIHLKPHTRFYIPNYNIYRNHRQDGHKDITALAVKKGITHTYLLLLLSVDATGVCIN